MKKANLLPKIVLILAGCFLSGSALHALGYETKLHNGTNNKMKVTVHYALCTEGNYIINAGQSKLYSIEKKEFSDAVYHGLCCITHFTIFFPERNEKFIYNPQETGFGLTCEGVELTFVEHFVLGKLEIWVKETGVEQFTQLDRLIH